MSLTANPDLRRVLENLTPAYTDGTRLDVEFGPKSHAKQDGETIVVNADYPAALGVEDDAKAMRMLTDTVSHEGAHVRLSDLLSKERFMTENDEYENVAGAIINTLEDQFIDRERTRDAPGLREPLASKVDHFMRSKPLVSGDMLDQSSQLLAGFEQVAFAGYARGIRDAPDDIKEFLARSRPLIDEYRDEHDTDRRYTLAQRAYDLFLEYADDPESADEYADEQDMTPADGELDGDADGDGESDGDESAAGDESDGTETADVDIEAELAAMASADDESDVTDWCGVSADAEYDEPSESDEARADEATAGEQSTDESSSSESDDTNDTNDESGKSDTSDKSDKSDESESLTVTAFDAEYSDVDDDERFVNETERYMHDEDLERDIRRAFEQFVNREREIVSRHGHRPHVRNFIRLRAGDTSVRELAYRQQIVENGDRAVVAVTDFSGSVDDETVKVALASCAIACEAIGDDFSATAFSTRFTGNVKRILDPGERFEYRCLDRVRTGGSTPTADGLADAKEMLRSTFAREKVAIVITDGQANVSRSRSGDAVGDAAALASELRQSGVSVIGIGVDNVSEGMMRDIFGERGYVRTEMSRLDDALVSVYKRQLDVVKRSA